MDLGESNYHAKNFWPGSTHLWENAIFQNSRFTHFMGTATSNGCHAHTVHQNQKSFSPIYQPRWVLQNGQQKIFWVADTHSSPYWPVVLKETDVLRASILSLSDKWRVMVLFGGNKVVWNTKPLQIDAELVSNLAVTNQKDVTHTSACRIQN